MSNSILLTGGFGNIGGRLAAHLSNSQDITLRLGSRSNRAAPRWAQRATTAKIDLLNLETIVLALKDIDTVVHLAALNDIECASDPSLAHEVNVVGTRNLVECAVRAGVERIVYISTAHVYGSPLIGYIDESHSTQPIHAYAVTHLEAEKMVANAHDSGQLVGLRMRLANGFGAPMDPTAKIWQILVNDLCRQAIETRQLTLKSFGDQERNFVPLSGVCNTIEHLIRLNARLVSDGLFNLGAEKSHSVWEMANRIADRAEFILGFKPPINRPTKSDQSEIAKLNYRSDKIKNTGLKANDSIDDEIDGLLRYCARVFSK